MSKAICHRCYGTGKFTDHNPDNPDAQNCCYGCEGKGQVDIPFPDKLCKRCNGTGRYTDQNPTRPGVNDWCDGCGGTGYAWE